ncbi:MAG TPA: FAD-dependent oxidoreductase, partial [Longimicrobiales bacterium]|nr:FAD-dependent oxidoreductase [Longimicrobiales bacterium]
NSGLQALETTRQLKQRGDSLALFLVDERMPGMRGTEFLEQAIELYPSAKRVLLTAWADTDVAINAINRIGIDHYLLKPWEPPEERLYPVLDDLLGDWLATVRPAFDGIRVAGTSLSPSSYAVKTFLSRNQVPYQWIDVENDRPTRELIEASATGMTRLPIVFFPDGSSMVQPSDRELAEKLGMQTRAQRPFYDLIVVGGGPAGLAAALYGASEGLHTVLIERSAPGGQAGTSSRIENYLGFPTGVSGEDLARRAATQAKRFGAEILTAQDVVAIERKDPYRIVRLADGSELSCKAVLIATGMEVRRLDVPGIDDLTGAGVYYGSALSEATTYRNHDVVIVGGANSAGQGAMFFSRYARSVTMLLRGPGLGTTMSDYLVHRIKETANVIVCPNTRVTGVSGNGRLESITLMDTNTQASRVIPASAMFIFIGTAPHTAMVAGLVERDAQGFILTGRDLMIDGKRPKGWTADRDPFLFETSVPGVFAAGDSRHGSGKRVAAAVGEGSATVSM